MVPDQGGDAVAKATLSGQDLSTASGSLPALTQVGQRPRHKPLCAQRSASRLPWPHQDPLPTSSSTQRSPSPWEMLLGDAEHAGIEPKNEKNEIDRHKLLSFSLTIIVS